MDKETLLAVPAGLEAMLVPALLPSVVLLALLLSTLLNLDQLQMSLADQVLFKLLPGAEDLVAQEALELAVPLLLDGALVRATFFVTLARLTGVQVDAAQLAPEVERLAKLLVLLLGRSGLGDRCTNPQNSVAQGHNPTRLLERDLDVRPRSPCRLALRCWRARQIDDRASGRRSRRTEASGGTGTAVE